MEIFVFSSIFEHKLVACFTYEKENSESLDFVPCIMCEILKQTS